MGQGGNNLAFYRYSVLVNLAIKHLAEQDGIEVAAAGAYLFVLGGVEPEFHAVEEVEPGPVDHCSRFGLLFSSEEDCGTEDPLEAIDKAAIVRTVFRKAEEIKHLSRGVKMNLAGFLPDGKRCDPDRNQAVLTEGQAELRMADNLKEETTVPAGMESLVSRGSAQWNTTEDERPGMEGEFLLAIVTLLADKLNRFELLHPPLRDSEGR